MNGLLMTLVRDAAAIFIQGMAAKRSVQHGIGTIIFYAVVSAFAGAALIFFFIALYRVLAGATSPEAAAGILCAANLVIIGILLIGRALAQRNTHAESKHDDPLGDIDFEALLSLGHNIERDIRKAAPKLTVAAAVLGIVVGVFPEVLGLLSKKKRRR